MAWKCCRCGQVCVLGLPVSTAPGAVKHKKSGNIACSMHVPHASDPATAQQAGTAGQQRHCNGHHQLATALLQSLQQLTGNRVACCEYGLSAWPRCWTSAMMCSTTVVVWNGFYRPRCIAFRKHCMAGPLKKRIEAVFLECSFEAACTGQQVTDSSSEYCILVRTRLGGLRVILGAEVDCYDPAGGSIHDDAAEW